MKFSLIRGLLFNSISLRINSDSELFDLTSHFQSVTIRRNVCCSRFCKWTLSHDTDDDNNDE